MQDQTIEIWRQIAQKFADEPGDVRFEIINEPVAPENKLLNEFNRRVLAAIRESNPTRIVYLTSNRWSQIATIDDVELPDDPHIAFTFHFYEPLVFTHQDASWVFAREGLPNIPFPGVVPEIGAYLRPGSGMANDIGRELSVAKDIDEPFAKLARWVEQNAKGREILLGEFGVFRAADDHSTTAWLRAVLDACERHGFAWNLWGYQSDEFGVLARDGSETRLLEAIRPYLHP
jgi:endoglucanase